MRVPQFLFFILLAQITVGFCDAQTLSGTIRDKSNKELLVGVNVIDDEQRGTTSNAEGQYKLNTRAGKIRVTFSYLGYKTKTVSIDISGAQRLDVFLEPVEVQLGQVVISAGRFEQKIEDVSVSMALMKPAEVSRNNSIDLDDAIDRIPGVNVLKGQVNIRGSSGFSYGTGSRVMMLLDDMPLLSADASDVKWNYLPIENIAQTEVIKGAASALFGSSALGGVINLRTGHAGSRPVTRISTFGQMYGAPAKEHLDVFENNRPIASGISAFHSRRIGRVDISAGLNALYQEKHRKEEFAKRLRMSLNTRYRFKKEGLTAGVNGNFMVDSAGLFLFWASDTLALVPDTGTNTKQISFRYHLDPYISYIKKNGESHKLRTRYFNNSFEGSTSKSEAIMLYAEYLFNKQWQLTSKYKFTLSTGVAQRSGIVNGDTLYGERSESNTALFAQTEHQLGKLKFTIGARAERIRLDTDPDTIVPVFRGGLNYQIAKGSFLRASYGQGFRMPSVAEKYARTQAGSIVILPNPEVMGERSWGAEAGIRQLFDFPRMKGFADLALFNTRYFDMIEYSFGLYIGEGLGFKAKNLTDANIFGVELSSGMEYAFKNSKLRLSGGYTVLQPLDALYNELTAEDENERFLKYRYKHLARIDAQMQNEYWMFGLNMRYNSFMLRIDESFNVFIDGVSDYRERHDNGDLIIDARLSRKIGEHFEVGLICRNVLNRSYTQIVANLGEQRNGVISLKLNY